MNIFYKSFIAIAFIVLMMISSADRSLTPLPNKPMAPEFLLRDMDEKIHELEDYQGKPIIVNFWATWCPPCRDELPSMNRAWKKVEKEGIKMIAINIGEDEESIREFTKKFPIDFTILLDETSEEISNWSIRGLPTTFIIDASGHVVYQAVGGREWDEDKLLDKVRKLKVQTSSSQKKKAVKE